MVQIKKSGADPPQSGKANKKRKHDSEAEDGSNKAPRRSDRSSGRGGEKHFPEPLKLIKYLLSHDSASLCRPKHETEALEEDPNLRSYTGTIPLSPFEELLAAVILSRPISHSLGQRSLRYLINEPRNLTNPKAIRSCTVEKLHQWLDEAKTQHKAKTAEQILGLANVVVEKGWAEDDEDATLSGLRKQIRSDSVGRENGQQRLKEMLKNGIKGIGETGTDIFLRRVQGIWVELTPFVDKRTRGSLEKLGLPSLGKQLLELIETNWKDLDVKNLAGENDKDKQRLAYVLLLERAVGVDLEGNVEEALADDALR